MTPKEVEKAFRNCAGKAGLIVTDGVPIVVPESTPKKHRPKKHITVPDAFIKCQDTNQTAHIEVTK